MIELSIFLFSSMLMLFLGGIILASDPKNVANRLFFVWVLGATGWMISNFLENVQAIPLVWRTLLLHIDFGVSVYATSILFVFTLIFTGRKVGIGRQLFVVFPGVLMMILSFSPWLLRDVFLNTDGSIGYVQGPLYEPFGITILAYVIGSAIVLLLARRTAVEPKRGQMGTMAGCLLITLLFSIPINFFLQNVLPYQVVRFGVYAFLIFVGGTAYAIVRHEFLKIRFFMMEVFLLGMLSTIITRLILSTSVNDFLINLVTTILLFVLGLFLVRSVTREIEQRSMLEEMTVRLQESNEKLTKLDATKTEFLSIASHQLRTPLSVIRGYVTMIQEGTFGKTTKRQEEVVKKIRSSTESLIELVNQLLSVSRIESGRTTVEVARMNIVPICREVVDFLSMRAKERKLELTCATPRMPMVLGDAAKIKEVLINLIENALKYTDKGFVRVMFFDEPHFVRIEVQDSGSGLTKDDIKKLFQKFSRAASAEVNGATGIGLGLYVGRRLIEAMGGEIWATSPGRGKGSIFAFRLRKAPGGKMARRIQQKVV